MSNPRLERRGYDSTLYKVNELIRISKMLRILLPYLKNKFVLVTIAFIVWVSFFDHNNIISQVKRLRGLKILKQQKEYYIEEIERNKMESNALKFDTASLERLAREKYLMKKDSEDIFIIIDE